MAQIAPANSSLVIKAQVAAQDISKVRTCGEKQMSDCQVGRVQLRVSTYPHADYGTLKGVVRSISPDAITAAAQEESPAASTSFYEVTIEPEHPYLGAADQQYFLKSGMEATADIISRQETVLTFLLREAKLLANIEN